MIFFREQLYGFTVEVTTENTCTVNWDCDYDGNNIGGGIQNYSIDRQGQGFSSQGGPSCRRLRAC